MAGVALVLTAICMLASPLMATAHQLASVIAVGAFFSGMAIPCLWAAVVDIGGNSSGVVMGIVNSVGNLAGIVISPLVGRLIDYIRETNGDWNLVIYVHVGFYIVAAICWLFINPTESIHAASNNPTRSDENHAD